MNKLIINCLLKLSRGKIVHPQYFWGNWVLKNPGWFLMYVLARSNTTRSIAIFLQKLFRGQPQKLNYLSQENKASLFPSLKVEQVVSSLKTNGFALGINLPQNTVQEILDFVSNIEYRPEHDAPLTDNSTQAEKQEVESKKDYSRGRYPDDFLLCSAIQQLLNDPKILEIAARYLGSEPKHVGSRLWWSFAGSRPYDLRHAGQTFHYDIDDYCSLRLFFYLTDVDTNSSPHVIARGSHNKKKFSDRVALSRQRSDEHIIDYYGSENVVTIYG
ncbi:MAG: hypothetical protein SWZ49_21720, partial [Cyanobacteriota bacterium]|nr:hypothetical protein [Cyanobacteriota bacterium]